MRALGVLMCLLAFGVLYVGWSAPMYWTERVLLAVCAVVLYGSGLRLWERRP